MLRPAIERQLRRLAQKLHVYIGSRHVFVDLKSRLASRPGTNARKEFDPGAGFDAAMTALATLLATIDAASGTVCDVVIADRWLLYDVVAIDALQVSGSTADAAITAMLADLGDTQAGALAVRWQWQRDGHSVLAMGIARERLSQLHEALDARELVARSVTGEFVRVFNGHRASLPQGRVVFAVGRNGAAQVALLADGSFRFAGYETDCSDATALARSAMNAMRARGEDTNLAADFIVDQDGKREEFVEGVTDAPRWSLVSPPAWAASL